MLPCMSLAVWYQQVQPFVMAFRGILTFFPALSFREQNSMKTTLAPLELVPWNFRSLYLYCALFCSTVVPCTQDTGMDHTVLPMPAFIS